MYYKFIQAILFYFKKLLQRKLIFFTFKNAKNIFTSLKKYVAIVSQSYAINHLYIIWIILLIKYGLDN
jgi:hypothetical protein